MSDALLQCEVDHVDGTFNALQRNQKLDWLRVHRGSVCRILSNARCLSEGVDVPALDAVMFLNPRNSVSGCGPVRRSSHAPSADGKEYGYIILPIGVPSDQTPEHALNDNKSTRSSGRYSKLCVLTTTASTP